MLTVFFAYCLIPCAEGSNLIVNGDFDPNFGSGATIQNGTDLIPFGWIDSAPDPSSLTNLNVVTASSFPSVSDASGTAYYMAFESPADNFTQDCLYQIISTTFGQEYTVTFWAAITAASPTLQLTPDWDPFETSGDDQIDAITGFNNGMDPVSSAGPVAFQEHSFTVYADDCQNFPNPQDGCYDGETGGQTYLYFHGVDSDGAVLLADVSVTTTSSAPEPKTFWLICGGLALLAGATRFQARKQNDSAGHHRNRGGFGGACRRPLTWII